MNKIFNIFFLSVFFCCFATTCFSQLRIQTANEIKINLLSTLILYPEIHYERVRSSEHIRYVKSDFFGWGFAAGAEMQGIPSSKDPEFSDYPRVFLNKYHVLGFMRLYFNRKENFLFHYDLRRPKLFFVEPSVAVVGFDDGVSLCLGASVGIKHLNVMDYTAELFFGGGTNFHWDNPVGYYRLGIVLGRRMPVVQKRQR